MKDMKSTPRIVITAAILVIVSAGAAHDARAQHVTPAMAATMGTPAVAGCEERARQATRMLDVLNANLERARQTNNEAEMRAALDAFQKGFTDLKGRLDECRADAQAPAAPAGGAMAGMDHSKMNMGGAQPPAVAPQAVAKPAAGARDHGALGHAEPAGSAAAPTTVRQISGPAEAALQAFQDALQIGNREVALQWLAPEATITESGVTDRSRDAYATKHMGVDMAFLKTGKVELIDRQVHPAGDSTHIVSTSHVTGRAGEMPVEVKVTERALLRKTEEGWRIVSLEWTVEPAKQGR